MQKSKSSSRITPNIIENDSLAALIIFVTGVVVFAVPYIWLSSHSDNGAYGNAAVALSSLFLVPIGAFVTFAGLLAFAVIEMEKGKVRRKKVRKK